jgi:hypothetical protein
LRPLLPKTIVGTGSGPMGMRTENFQPRQLAGKDLLRGQLAEQFSRTTRSAPWVLRKRDEIVPIPGTNNRHCPDRWSCSAPHPSSVNIILRL